MGGEKSAGIIQIPKQPFCRSNNPSRLQLDSQHRYRSPQAPRTPFDIRSTMYEASKILTSSSLIWPDRQECFDLWGSKPPTRAETSTKTESPMKVSDAVAVDGTRLYRWWRAVPHFLYRVDDSLVVSDVASAGVGAPSSCFYAQTTVTSRWGEERIEGRSCPSIRICTHECCMSALLCVGACMHGQPQHG